MSIFNRELRPIAVLFLLVMCVLVWGESPHAGDAGFPSVRLSLEQGLVEARTLIEEGRGEQAWTLLGRLIREEPSNTEVNLLWVRAAGMSGRMNQALAAMERLVMLHPRDAHLRAELARSYARLGDLASAQAEMEIAMELDPSLVDMDRDLELVRAASKARGRWDRFQVSGRLAVGLLWDSNVNSGLDDLDVSVGGVQLSLKDSARRREAFGEYVNSTVNGGWRIGEDSPWWVVGDLSAFGRNCFADVPSNQYFGWGRLALGLRRVSARHIVDVRARLEHSMYEPVDHATATGFDVMWLYAPTSNLQVITRTGLETRTYLERDGRDGLYWYAGSYLRWLWGTERTNSLMLGARALGADAREDESSYEGWEAILRLSLSPLERLDIVPFVGYRELLYHDAATRLSSLLHEDNHFDQIYMGGVTLAWHWTENLATEVGWQYLRNESNSSFYRFDQHQINVGLVYSF